MLFFGFTMKPPNGLETYNFIEQLLEAPLGCLGNVKTF